MTIKELKDYLVICSKGSLSKAAKALFITPQGLSRVLKNLETELECTLVNRVASGLELTESAKQELNEKLRLLAESAREHPGVSVLWFLPDERKSGGSYVRTKGRVKKVDAYRELLVLEELEIPFGGIYELEREEQDGK